MARADLVASSLFGDDDLTSPRAIREFLNRARRISRTGSGELWDIKEQLHAIISNSRGHALMFGIDQRRAATRIVEPLGHAATAYDAAAGLAVMAWQRFEKEFGDILEAERRGSGKPRGIKWGDL